MDARLLDNLTKRELEKQLGITRKAHQSSIVQGITFLRMIKYDRQVFFTFNPISALLTHFFFSLSLSLVVVIVVIVVVVVVSTGHRG